MLDNNSDPNQLSRLDLLRLAHSLHVSDADVMTRSELQAAIEKARRPEPRPVAQPVTWVSVARRLLASIVEQGLNLPDAAALIRGDTKLSTPPKAPPPVATVTLARIYAAQGHLSRAIRTLDQVLESEPDHERASALRAQLEDKRQRDKASGSQSQAEAAESDAGVAKSEPLASAPASSSKNGLAPAANDLAENVDVSPLRGAVPNAGEVSAFDTERPTLAGGSAPVGEVPPPEATVPDLPELTSDTGAPAASASTFGAAAASEASPPASCPATGASSEARAAAHEVSEPEPWINGAAMTEAPSSAEGLVADLAGAPPAEAAPTEAAPTEAPPDEAAPPTEPAPAHISDDVPAASAPGATVPAATLAAPIPAPPPPLVSALLLIETNTPVSYLYWELAPSATRGEPRWICVVAHTPTASGSRRLERRFPVYRSWGALRLEGVPRHSVLRAKLTEESTADAKPLVVAAAIRTDRLQAPDAIELLFSPHPKANPLALANRAAHLLEDASAVYWDRL